MSSSGRTYRVYEDGQGEPKNHWQYYGEPTVPGVGYDEYGRLIRPEPRWIVRATSATEACAFVYDSATSQSRDDGLGIWSDAGMNEENW